MAHRTVHRLACLVTLMAVTSSANKEQSRWSRQISSYTSDIGDWVPLSGPVEREPPQPPQTKRQAVAEPRILTEPFPTLTRPTGFGHESFPSRTYYNSASNRQLYLQSVPSVPTAPQNYLTEQGFGQSLRLGLSPPNYPLNQGFVAPPFTFEGPPPAPPKPRPQPVPPSPINFPPSNVPVSGQAKPFGNQGLKKPDVPKFVDGYRAENVNGDKKKPQSLQRIKFDNVGKPPRIETIPQNTKVEREEVQLLYVPLESLNRGQFNFRSPLTSPQILNSELYSQVQKPNPPKQTFINDYQRPALKPAENFQGQNYFTDFSTQFKEVDQVPKFSTINTPFPTVPPTTPKPKKLKPHQPPLAIFMTKETAKANQVKVGDVLSSLKNAETIAVLDSVNPLNAPKVFIGPSNLPPPENFVRFELPYLSNIENSEKKLKQLPFFVAPLSYNTPQGFAKIPFPSPHVGSVVINSLIRESTQTQAPPRATVPTYVSNAYTATPPTYKPEIKATQKPSFSYFSTAIPNEKPVSNYQSNYYSFEPQSVSTIRPAKQPEINSPPPKSGSYFLSNVGSQYNSNEYVNIPQQDTFKPSEAIDALPPAYNIPRKPETTTTLRTTTTTTTTTTTPKPPSTYPSQLLETHNPYSINQAFHFSTPLDYHSYLDDVKQPYATHGTVENTPPPHTSSPVSPTTSPPTPPKPEEIITEKPKIHQQSTPVYLQNYNPEIHYNSKEQSWRYPVFNPNDYVEKTEITSQQTQPTNPAYTDVNPSISSFNTEYSQNIETQPPTVQESSKEIKPTIPEVETPTRYEDYQYETHYETTEGPTTPVSTTTTRRVPLRTRGRPRYTTTSRPESYESSTRTIVTRRPLRERRPLPTRPRYEPNRITTERINKKPLDSYESTTKSTRTRTRGRIQYRPSDNEDIYDRRIKTQSSKVDDLAYQRDVLHQNYPVTLMERTSTVDIEAITEPAPRLSSTIIQEPITETDDTENAYTNERVSISQHVADTQPKSEPSIQTFTSRTTVYSDASYEPKLPSSRNEEYLFQPRSSVAPVQTPSYDEQPDQEDDIYVKHTTPEQRLEKAESNSYVTESVSEQEVPNNSGNDEFSTFKQEEITTSPEAEVTKTAIQENHESDEEENVVQTTPSYNRVRVRPGVIRQYHQASTESPRTKERRRQQAVTYRPAFDRRRTTMRIDEIEADLKTKQVHSRPDFQDFRHPVYKPEPTVEPLVSSLSTTESSTKRGHFRRRRPSNTYTTTSTEASGSTKRIYEVKNRFRGRRPTEKPTEKPDIQTEAPSSTVRSSLHTRYSHRPRLSERYNKKTEPEPEPESEDQESNFSINRPKYVEPSSEQWSPKISSDTFKPYNPNNIVDDNKVTTTERRSDKDNALDIITARNEYDEILLTVTPASNRLNKKIPDIPPTLEALVEQAKVTKSDSGDTMSTFESMLEEVMKSLEDQDRDEYSTSVIKHKGGEIGEIPPERIISSGDSYIQKTTTIREQETTTAEPAADDSVLLNEDDDDHKVRRRGFWKKVKVRPVTTESIEFAESQYYTNTVNRLGQSLKSSKTTHDKSRKDDKPKVTTYKPHFQNIKDLFDKDYDTLSNIDGLPNVEIQKIHSNTDEKDETLINEESQKATVYVQKEPQADEAISPGDLDLGTGSPDPTLDDLYFTTEAATSKPAIVNRSDGFSFMDYLFGVTSEDNDGQADEKNKTVSKTTELEIQITTETPKSKIVTTETTFIPEEITASLNEETTENIPDIIGTKKADNDGEDNKMEEATEISVIKVESSSVSSFMNPANVMSTSMSTEVSHETEICFRGKCIKTSRDIL